MKIGLSLHRTAAMWRRRRGIKRRGGRAGIDREMAGENKGGKANIRRSSTKKDKKRHGDKCR